MEEKIFTLSSKWEERGKVVNGKVWESLEWEENVKRKKDREWEERT